MLLELRIENLLVIERAELRLGPGLNAITGETGAGKTVLAHSLDLLMGGRARPQIVRPGAAEAYVEGVFDLPDGLFDDPELADLSARMPDDATEVVLARRVGAGGRTSAYVQGRSANVADLRALGSRLLAFYGQHEHRRLTLASAQLDVLDGFAGDKHLGLREDYRAAHAEVRAARRELDELREREGTRERDLDLMRFELEEIDAAKPDPRGARRAGARPGAPAPRGVASAAAAARSRAWPASTRTGAGPTVASAPRRAPLARWRASTLRWTRWRSGSRPRPSRSRISRASSLVREGIDAEPGRLEQVEERLAAIERLERSTAGRSRRCSRTRSAAGPRSSGWRARRSWPGRSSGA